MRRLDVGKWLMMVAVVVSMPRWAGAFISADVETVPPLVSQLLNGLNIVSGLAMGILEVAAAAFMLEAWGKMKPKTTWNAKGYNHRWKVLTGFIVGLFVLMPVILAPYMVARMTGQTVADVLHYTGLMYAWSVAVVLAPAFVIGGVAIARNEGVEEQPKVQPVAQPKVQPKAQPDVQPQVQPVNLEGNLGLVLELYQRNPKATQQEIATQLGISRQMVSKYKKQLNGLVSHAA